MTQRADAGHSQGPLLEARDVSFGYARGSSVVENWTATFAAGTMTALTGPSGRGKSTMLYLLGLMLRPQSGEISIDGRPTSQLPDSQRARHRARTFGFVFQDAALDPTRTLMDNVTEPSFYRGDSRRAATHLGRSLLDRFGVDLPSERKPGQVSGGQAQRIALCRALLTDPRILLADEPTGNLDPVTSGVVVDALRDHARSGAAVVVVTHSPSLADLCDEEVRL